MKKVAIVGVEGSGKTVMLAGLGELYSRPDVDGYFLMPKNFSTAAYVSTMIRRMRKGEWPAATAEDVLQGLNWTLKRKSPGERPENVCEVSFLDFAGEVYRVAFGISTNAAAGISEQVGQLKRYVCEADGLIVLINLRDVIVRGGDDPRVEEAMWITNSILSVAVDETGDRKPPRAAIVLSQADSYADTIRSCGGAKGVLNRYLPYVANNYDWLDVLSVSAVDKTVVDDDGNVVPAPDFKSTGLAELFDWLLEKNGKGGDGEKRDVDLFSAMSYARRDMCRVLLMRQLKLEKKAGVTADQTRLQLKIGELECNYLDGREKIRNLMRISADKRGHQAKLFPLAYLDGLDESVVEDMKRVIESKYPQFKVVKNRSGWGYGLELEC